MKKRKKPTNHNARSKKFLLEVDGCTVVAKTEWWDSFAHRKHDLFGFCDMIALLDGEMFAVQVTDGSNHSKRRKKILGLDDAYNWIKASGRIFVLSWRKVKNRWKPRMEEIFKDDFDER